MCRRFKIRFAYFVYIWVKLFICVFAFILRVSKFFIIFKLFMLYTILSILCGCGLKCLGLVCWPLIFILVLLCHLLTRVYHKWAAIVLLRTLMRRIDIIGWVVKISVIINWRVTSIAVKVTEIVLVLWWDL